MAYTKLPGTKRTLTSTQTLWLGDDHLLVARSNFFQQCYQRLYYKRIQAVSVLKTNTGKILNAIFAILFLIPASPVLIDMYEGRAIELVKFEQMLTVAFIFLFSIPLIINILRGPTCRTYIQTDYNLHELPSLKRLPSAQRFIKKISGKLESLQGTLKKTDITFWTLQADSAPDTNLQQKERSYLLQSDVGWNKWLYLASSAALFFMGIATWFRLSLPEDTFLAISIFLAFITLLLLAMAMAHTKSHPKLVKNRLLGISMFSVISSVMFMEIVYFASRFFFAQKQALQSPASFVTSWQAASLFDHPYIAAVLAIFGLSCILAGLWGSKQAVLIKK